MPLYRNDSTSRIEVLNGNNNRQVLAPGEQTETLQYYDITDLTKVSDLPYINPLAEYNTEDFVAAETRTLVLSSPTIAKIRIQKVTGTFNIYLQSTANTPAILENWTEDDYPVDILIDGRADQIILDCLSVTGSIQVMEIKAR